MIRRHRSRPASRSPRSPRPARGRDRDVALRRQGHAVAASRPTRSASPSRGCLAGGVELPECGPTWQAMRLGRNHHWGNPATIAFIEDLSRTATRARLEGPLRRRHRPGPRRPGQGPRQPPDRPRRRHLVHPAAAPRPHPRASARGLGAIDRPRRTTSATSTPTGRRRTPRCLEAAARDPRVERIFVTAPGQARALRQSRARGDAAWLRKIRPWWGHHDHFHVRLNCPTGDRGCVDPAPIPPGDGCKDAVWWVTDALLPPDPNAPKPKPKPPLQLADLPPQCAAVLEAR